jgi:hypothetical protein
MQSYLYFSRSQAVHCPCQGRNCHNTTLTTAVSEDKKATLTTLSQSASAAESKPHECLHPGSVAPLSRTAVTRTNMVLPLTEVFAVSRSSPKLICVVLSLHIALSNYVLTRNSQSYDYCILYRCGQAPVYRQRSRCRRHVRIRSIIVRHRASADSLVMRATQTGIYTCNLPANLCRGPGAVLRI